MNRPLLALLLVLTTALLGAQDTRGALVPGTMILLADGTTVDVKDLDVGAELWSIDDAGKPTTTKVTAVRRQHADSYLLVKAGSAELQATGAHRLMVPGGKFVRFDTVKEGDALMVPGKAGPTEAKASGLRLYPANLVAYDLTVEGHRPFVAGGLLVGD